MKRYTIRAMLALCLACGAPSLGIAKANATCMENAGGGNNPSGIKPNLAKNIIKAAANQAGFPAQAAWVNYVQGINTIDKVPGHYRVTLVGAGGAIVVVDIADDL